MVGVVVVGTSVGRVVEGRPAMAREGIARRGGTFGWAGYCGSARWAYACGGRRIAGTEVDEEARVGRSGRGRKVVVTC